MNQVTSQHKEKKEKKKKETGVLYCVQLLYSSCYIGLKTSPTVAYVRMVTERRVVSPESLIQQRATIAQLPDCCLFAQLHASLR